MMKVYIIIPDLLTLSRGGDICHPPRAVNELTVSAIYNGLPCNLYRPEVAYMSEMAETDGGADPQSMFFWRRGCFSLGRP